MLPAALQPYTTTLPPDLQLTEVFPENLQILLQSLKPEHAVYWRGLARIAPVYVEANDSLEDFAGTFCLGCHKHSSKCACNTDKDWILGFSPLVQIETTAATFEARLRASVVCQLRRDFSETAVQQWTKVDDKEAASKTFIASLAMQIYASIAFRKRDDDIHVTVYHAYTIGL